MARTGVRLIVMGRLKHFSERFYSMNNKSLMLKNTYICSVAIEEGILETKTECYAKDKVKSPPFFRLVYNNFIFLTTTFIFFTKLNFRRSF